MIDANEPLVNGLESAAAFVFEKIPLGRPGFADVEVNPAWRASITPGEIMSPSSLGSSGCSSLSSMLASLIL